MDPLSKMGLGLCLRLTRHLGFRGFDANRSEERGKRGPRWCQVGLKRGARGVQDGAKRVQDGPRMVQEDPRGV